MIIIFLLVEILIFKMLNMLTIVNGNNTTVTAYAFVMIASIIFLLLTTRVTRKRNEYLMIMGGYIFRLALWIWNNEFSHIFQLPNSSADAIGYHNVAIEICNGGSVETATERYSAVLAAFYKCVGVNIMLGGYSNLIFSMFTIFTLVSILNLLQVNRKYRKLAIFLVCFLPNYAMMSVFTLRESLITLLIAVSLYYFLKWWKDGGGINILVAFTLVLYASSLHTGAMASALAYIIVLVYYNRKKQMFKFTTKSIVIAIICCLGISIVYTNFGELFLGKIQGKTIESVMDSKEEGSGGAGYDISISTGNSTVDIIVNTPVRMVYYVLSPMPWDWRGVSDIIAFCFSSSFYGWVLIVAWKALKGKKLSENDNEEINLMILFTFIVILAIIIFSWGVENAGTAMRHRDKFIVPNILLLIYGKYVNKKYQNNVMVEDRNEYSIKYSRKQ